MSLIHEALKRAAGEQAVKRAAGSFLQIKTFQKAIPSRYRTVLFLALFLLSLGALGSVYLNRSGPMGSVLPALTQNQPEPSAEAKTSSIPSVPDKPLPEAKGLPSIAAPRQPVLPEDPTRTHTRMGENYYKEGNLDEAAKEYQAALSLAPKNATFHNNLGLVLKAQGRYREAELHYEQALELDPSLPSAFNNLGRLYDDQNRIDEAIQLYQKALRLAPDFAAAHLNYASVLERAGYLGEARQHYQAFLTFASPQNQEAITLVRKHLESQN